MSDSKAQLPPRLLHNMALVLELLRQEGAANVRLLVENAYLCGQTDATRIIRETFYPVQPPTPEPDQ